MSSDRLQEGDRFPVEQLAASLAGPTVIFFYPAAFTGGCSIEARRFNVLQEDFVGAGVDLIGASVDDAERNTEFGECEHLTYTLHSDPDKKLAGELGILGDFGERGSLSKRVTYLLDADGTIRKFWEVERGEAVARHPDEVLDEVKAMRLRGDLVIPPRNAP